MTKPTQKLCEKKIINFFNFFLEVIKKYYTFAPQNTECSVRLGVRTPDFHSGNRGSIPLRSTKKPDKFTYQALFFVKSFF